jgi:hypothetical protein
MGTPIVGNLHILNPENPTQFASGLNVDYHYKLVGNIKAFDFRGYKQWEYRQVSTIGWLLQEYRINN